MRVISFLTLLPLVHGFAPFLAGSPKVTTTTSLQATGGSAAFLSRQDFLNSLAVAGAISLLPTQAMADEEVKLPSGVTYTIITKGTGPKPDIGELAGIRFRAFAGENKIDDIFDTPEPYYTRVGIGGLLKVRLQQAAWSGTQGERQHCSPHV